MRGPSATNRGVHIRVPRPQRRPRHHRGAQRLHRQAQAQRAAAGLGGRSQEQLLRHTVRIRAQRRAERSQGIYITRPRLVSMSLHLSQSISEISGHGDKPFLAEFFRVYLYAMS